MHYNTPMLLLLQVLTLTCIFAKAGRHGFPCSQNAIPALGTQSCRLLHAPLRAVLTSWAELTGGDVTATSGVVVGAVVAWILGRKFSVEWTEVTCRTNTQTELI